MPTVVDSLVVTLGLDGSEFKRESGVINVYLKNTSEQAGRTAADLSAKGQQASEFFSRMKNEALGLLGVFLGGRGLEQFVRDTTTSMAALGREARNIGESVPDLDAFRHMIERSGGNADAAAASLRHLTDEVANWKIGNASADFTGGMAAINAQLTDSPITVFQKFAAYADAHKNDVPLVNLVGKKLGLDQGTVNEALRGLEQVKKDWAEVHALGTRTGEMTKNAADLQTAWADLGQSLGHTGDTIMNDLSPALINLLRAVTEFIKANPELTKEIIEGTGAIVGLLSVLTAGRVVLAIANLGGLARGLGLIGGAASAVTGGGAVAATSSILGSLVAGLAGFATGLTVIAGAVDIWKRGPFGNMPDDTSDTAGMNAYRAAHGLPPLPKEGATAGFAPPDPARPLAPRAQTNPLTPAFEGPAEHAQRMIDAAKTPPGLPQVGSAPLPKNPYAPGYKPPTPAAQPLPDAAPGMAPPEGQALLDQIAVGESAGRYDVRYSPTGDKTFSGFADHPRIYEPTRGGQVSSAAGKYQFTATTWDDIQKKLHLPDFSPKSQEIGGWYLAKRDYATRTGGRDLEADLKANRGDKQALGDIAAKLSQTWTSAPGGAEPNKATSGFVQGLDQRLKALGTAPAAAALAPSPGPAVRLNPGPSAPAGGPSAQASGDTTIHINVGDVHTAATDAHGIARDLHGEMNDAMIAQANRGLA